MFEKKVEIGIYYDFYGRLLTDRTRAVMDMYYEDDFSLSEIAEELGISRQAVHDSAKKAERSLRSYEEKLGLVKKFQETEELIQRANAELDIIIDTVESSGNGHELVTRLRRVKEELNKIDEE